MRTYETAWLARHPREGETIQEMIDLGVEHACGTQTVADDVGPAYAATLLVDDIERSGTSVKTEESTQGIEARSKRTYFVYVRMKGETLYQGFAVSVGFHARPWYGRQR